MSMEDLTQGFMNMSNRQERDEKWFQSVAAAVTFNADLLNSIVTRVNNGEAVGALTVGKCDRLSAQVDQLSVDVVGALKTVDGQRDSKLRAELNAMAAELAKSHDELSAKVNAAGAAQGPGLPPGLNLGTLVQPARPAHW